MSGIRTRIGIKALVEANLPSGTGAISAANHREVAKSAVDSALYRGDTEIVVISMTLTAPPGGESDLDAYVVATPATGDWSGQDGDIAIYDNSISPAAWFFHTPADGQAVWNRAQDTQYRWDTGASPVGWTPIDSTGANLPFSGARVKRVSTTFAINNGLTPVSVEFNGEDYDTDAYHDNSSNPSRLTIPAGTADAYYLVTAGYETTAYGEANVLQAFIAVDGESYPGKATDYKQMGSGSFSKSGTLSTEIILSANQYVELRIQHNRSSLDVNIDFNSASFISIRRTGLV